MIILYSLAIAWCFILLCAFPYWVGVALAADEQADYEDRQYIRKVKAQRNFWEEHRRLALEAVARNMDAPWNEDVRPL